VACVCVLFIKWTHQRQHICGPRVSVVTEWSKVVKHGVEHVAGIRWTVVSLSTVSDGGTL
jgi:hypothetical protein